MRLEPGCHIRPCDGVSDPVRRQTVNFGKAAGDDHAAVAYGMVDERAVVRRIIDVVMIGLVDDDGVVAGQFGNECLQIAAVREVPVGLFGLQM